MRDHRLLRLAAALVALLVAPPLLAQAAPARAPTATSRYTYSSVDQNPIWGSAIANGYLERRFGRITEARTTYLPYPAQEPVGNPNPPTTP